MKAKKAAAIMLCAVLGTSMITGVSVSAKDKDELVLYTWDGMFPQEVLDDFEKETGTKGKDFTKELNRIKRTGAKSILLPGEYADAANIITQAAKLNMRSEERRVGKECRSGWWPDR